MSQITYTAGEMDKLFLIKQIIKGELYQGEVAKQLRLSVRQVRRLVKRVKLQGAEGIKGLHKGSNRSFTNAFKQKVLTIVINRYSDFGPTFAAEKLELCDGLKLNKETLRQWMIEAGMWKGRERKNARIHQSRERRPRFGELIQIDGSHHDWFEGRAPKCCLLVFIDDATSKIIGLHFDLTETTLGYMKLIKDHLVLYGRPIAYYSDKHSIFKMTREQAIDSRIRDTQLHRALRELDIELICAHSSQAKGRVERANQTLQDRLIKEMRLAGVSTIEGANKFTKSFIIEYNKRFSVVPANPEDAHRKLHQNTQSLSNILSIQSKRRLTKNLEFSLNAKIYQIKTKTTGYRLRNAEITICNHTDGHMEVLHDNKPLEYSSIVTQAERIKQCDSKEINTLVDSLIAA